VDNGFRSRRSIIAEGGGDVEDTLEEIELDNDLAASKKLLCGAAKAAANAAPDDNPEDE
jgi:hypothetical protein